MDNSENTELNFCFNCMTRMASGQTVCPACGHDNSRHQNPESAMPAGTILQGKYLVGRVLGQGGFGITYLGFDIVLNIRVAIKEYFPTGVGIRSPHSVRVTAVSSQEKAEGFRKGCSEFQEEARRLAAIESPNIVKVRDYFRENGTAYIIMNYLDGSTLTKEVAACGGRIPWQRVIELFKPLILELDKLHKAHLIHRDIKPDNIKVVKDDDGGERLVLLDFGAARSFVSAEVTGSYSAMVTHGYAPVEQYSPKSRQGPYTDIYAICATMYAVITGNLPATATDRMTGEADIRTFSEMGEDMPPHIEKAILHGLEVRSTDRPQSMRALYDELNGKEPDVKGSSTVQAEKPAPEPRKEEKPEVRKPVEAEKPKKKPLWLLPVLLAVLAAAGFFLFKGSRQNQSNSGEPLITLETQDALQAQQTGTPSDIMPTSDQTATALEEMRAELEQTEAAFHVMETESVYEETRQAMDMRMTDMAAAKTNAVEPTATPTAKATATKAATRTPKPTATKAATATPKPTAVKAATATPKPVGAVTSTKTQLEVGDIITFGQYEQDGNTANGAEAIEWQVLAVEKGKVLVISRYGLEAMPYNDSNRSVTWETSTLRKWLNGTFYAKAFSSAEKGQVLSGRVTNPDNPSYGTKGGNDMTDRIFLLSIDEAKKYFAGDAERQCRPTTYAKDNGANINKDLNAVWWLRSPGFRENYAANIDGSGSINRSGNVVSSAKGAVRPAFWLYPGTETQVIDSTDKAEPTAAPKPVGAVTSTKAQLEVGDFITFGQYEQDGNTANGAEAIEWQVLAVEEGRALVISRYGLEAMPYNDSNTSVTWETSTLRKWLNGDFYNKAFSSTEKSRIQEVTVKNDNSAQYGKKSGNDTKDRIFLLSFDEASQYFMNNEARKCQPTTYAKNKGANVNKDRGGTTWWWLRTRGSYDGSAVNVYINGNIRYTGTAVNSSDGSVRPAFWLYSGTETPVIDSTDKAEPTAAPKPVGAVTSTKAQLEVGDIITFGQYEQDGNTANGAEAIEWQVLTVEKGKALVISKYGLETKRYNQKSVSVTWETCTLRKWLNGEFFNSAFTSEEKKLIQEVRVKDPDNAKYGTKGGNDTTDRIFLLSIEEVNQYFANNEARKCKPTTFTKNNGAEVFEDVGGTTWWWLRSPGGSDRSAAAVAAGGHVNISGHIVDYSGGSVRPAFWLNL